ncbi:Kazal-like serine protease inhibitor domain-containing protein, partial [Phytophthora sojae]
MKFTAVAILALIVATSASADNNACVVLDCPKNYDPVCANNGFTYLNQCEFDNAACDIHIRVQLKVLHTGMCRRDEGG